MLRQRLKPVPWSLGVMLACAMVAMAATSGDGGSGGDASNDLETATALPGEGAYTGKLAYGDVDWYRLDLPESDAILCSEYHMSAPRGALAALQSGLDGPGFNASFTDGASTVFLAHAVTDLRLGVEAMTSADGNAMSPHYDFTIAAHAPGDLPSADGGSGADAGGSVGSAVAIEDGCHRGTLNVDIDDVLDYYTFEATAGQLVYLSLDNVDGNPLGLTLMDPSGGSVVSIFPGEVTAIELPEAGSWVLKLEVPSVTLSDAGGGLVEYVFGTSLRDDPPPSNPCRPACDAT